MSISVNDTTILAMLSRYPGMSATEADDHIARIEHEENIPVCHAVIGRISPDDLNDDARKVYNEFQRWSADRTRREFNQQAHARATGNQTRLAAKLLDLRDRGIISEELLVLYGVSGPLPTHTYYYTLSDAEKAHLWEERMQRRFGANWRNQFERLPRILRHRIERVGHDWVSEGF